MKKKLVLFSCLLMLFPLIGCEGEGSDNADGPDFDAPEVTFDEPEIDIPEINSDGIDPFEVPGDTSSSTPLNIPNSNPNSPPSNSEPRPENTTQQTTTAQDDTCERLARANFDNAGINCADGPTGLLGDPFDNF